MSVEVSTRPKRIGMVTGGGDCPGLNAVVRAIVGQVNVQLTVEKPANVVHINIR